MHQSRNRFALVSAALVVGVGLWLETALAAAAQAWGADESMGSAELSARPSAPVKQAPSAPGLAWLEVTEKRKPALFVPASLPSEGSVPLVVLLHGAGAGASDILPLMQGEAEAHGFLLLAPQSQGPTWDAIMGRFGEDVAVLDRALSAVFDAYRIDLNRVGVAGFSDGASYALTLALANGDLFTHALAFSPGFFAPVPPTGSPQIFVSHGDADPVLPIDRCSRRIVPLLTQAGYAVDYREFAGGHVVPTDMVRRALDRLLEPADGP